MNWMKTLLIILLIIVLGISALFVVGSLMGGDKDNGQAVEFTAETVQGEKISLSDCYQKNGAVLVFFDRSQIKSAALLQNISAGISETDVRFVLVAQGETESTAFSEYLRQNNVTEDVVISDSDGQIAAKYNITTCPVTYFINAEGSVRAVSLSNLNPGSVEKYLGYITNK